MNFLALATVFVTLLSFGNATCSIEAKAYGSSACMVSLGSDSWNADEGECFANNVDGYSAFECDGSTTVNVLYYDSESDCKSQSGGTTATFKEDTCTYSEQRGFYVKVKSNVECESVFFLQNLENLRI